MQLTNRTDDYIGFKVNSGFWSHLFYSASSLCQGYRSRELHETLNTLTVCMIQMDFVCVRLRQRARRNTVSDQTAALCHHGPPAMSLVMPTSSPSLQVQFIRVSPRLLSFCNTWRRFQFLSVNASAKGGTTRYAMQGQVSRAKCYCGWRHVSKGHNWRYGTSHSEFFAKHSCWMFVSAVLMVVPCVVYQKIG